MPIVVEGATVNGPPRHCPNNDTSQEETYGRAAAG